MQEEDIINTPAGSKWQTIEVKNHNGINLPLFSLHTEKSCGVGEFTDLIPWFSWCRDVGFDVIQLLPLNDTGHHTTPYSGISAFALNPIHLGLTSLPNVDQYPDLAPLIGALQALNRTTRVDYKSVREGKKKFFRAYYSHEKDKLLSNSDYQIFCAENTWLDSFALFKTLKILNNWKDWQDWEEDIRTISQEKYEYLLKKFQDQIDYHKVIQYLCFGQLREVKKLANQQGIFLKGDIPILLSRDSADVWFHKDLFALEYEAGAPPDMFSQDGQCWGFPLYNWHEHERTQFAWWGERLHVAESLYDLYRIDHVVGFFRIWAVPFGHSAKEGKYIPTDFNEAMAQGEKIMNVMLNACAMLPIGEDLGVVPTEVRACLTKLGIPGTKVMRWERFWNEPRQPFIDPKEYSPLSMTTVSTHDSETVEMWWQNHPEEAQAFCQINNLIYTPEIHFSQQKGILYDSHHSGSLFHINLFQEYLPLVPELRGDDPYAERVNVPGTISDKNWSYRYKPTVEEIVQNNHLKHELTSLLAEKRE